MIEHVMRRPAVQAVTGLSRSTLYAMIGSGDFPQPIRIGKRAVAWKESEIKAWIDSRANARR